MSSDVPADLNLKGEFENRAKNYLQRLKAEQERADKKRNKPSMSTAATQDSVSFFSTNYVPVFTGFVTGRGGGRTRHGAVHES